ncbi:MAG TPA: ABC transporter permease, partial [Thermoanaerobaculia bacterium]|nr:ABC transporter permease [Thermoanaerobaculia bacterium]
PDVPRSPVSYAEYQEIQKVGALRDLAVFTSTGATVGQGEKTAFAWVQAVNGGFFSFFGQPPALGRLLQPGDDRPGADPVAVVSHLFWKGTLGGDPGVIGKPLRINGQTYTVVGVVREGFQGYGRATPLYIPLAQIDSVTGLERMNQPESRWISVLGLLNGSVSAPQAQAALDLASSGLDQALPLSQGKRRFTLALATQYDPDAFDTKITDAARVLMAASLLFLLLGCANVANLLLARATTRQREWGIRASLGADRARLAGAALPESLVLCLAGGALGLAFAAGLLRRMESLLLTAPGGLGNWSEAVGLLRIDPRTFAFAMLIALGCAVLCGVAPAFHVLRGDLLAAVKADTAGAVGPSGALAPRKLLVIAQVGLCVILVLGGSLLVRTLRNAHHVDPGFDPDRLLMATLYVPRSAGLEGQGATAVYERLLDGLESLPGIQSAALTQLVPMSGFARTTQATAPERPDQPLEAAFNMVSADFFQTVGIPILQGRALDRRDRRDTAPAVVVNRELAKQLWGNANPVGRLLTLSEPPRPGEAGPAFEVVGVAGDVRLASVLEPPQPAVYLSHQQRSHSRMTLVVRSAESTAVLAPALREALRTAHPDLSIVDLVSGSEQMGRGLVQQRLHAEIAALFGLLGLGVAVLGLFGLLTYTVSLRVREFGVRMAIGAGRRDVLRLVLRQGMTLVGVGLALGLAGAFALTRLLAGILFGVETTDPLTFVGVPIVLVLVTLAACWLPARRAARLDPLAALRSS